MLNVSELYISTELKWINKCPYFTVIKLINTAYWQWIASSVRCKESEKCFWENWLERRVLSESREMKYCGLSLYGDWQVCIIHRTLKECFPVEWREQEFCCISLLYYLDPKRISHLHILAVWVGPCRAPLNQETSYSFLQTALQFLIWPELCHCPVEMENLDYRTLNSPSNAFLLGATFFIYTYPAFHSSFLFRFR